MRKAKLTICRAKGSLRAKSRPDSSWRKYRRSSVGITTEYVPPAKRQTAPTRAPTSPLGVQPHHAGRAALVEIDDLAAGTQKIAERPESQRLFAERRVHPLHLCLDRRVVQPFDVVVLLHDDLQRPFQKAGRRGLRVLIRRLARSLLRRLLRRCGDTGKRVVGDELVARGGQR